MTELVGILVIGLVLGFILAKYWKDILVGVLCVIIVPLYIFLCILTFPLRLFDEWNTSQGQIVREYDRIFHEAEDMYQVYKINRKINKKEAALERKEKKGKSKEIRKILKNSRWVI